LSVEPLKRTVRRAHPSNKSKLGHLLALCDSALPAIVAALLAVACAAPAAATGTSHLPTYGAEDASLLDDGFSGHLFETAFVPGAAGDDLHFKDRVRAAQSIWLVKVATVSRVGSLGNNRRYELTFRTLDGLAGAPPPPQVSLSISGKDPSFHWLDRVGGAWVGRELLLMVRDYRVGERLVMHFHGEPNSPELRARIGEILAEAARSERAAHPPKK